MPLTTDYLGKDVTDLPVTGKMKDENDRDIIVKTSFLDIVSPGFYTLLNAKPFTRYRVLHYSVMGLDQFNYCFKSLNTQITSRKFYSYAADSGEGSFVFQTNFNESLAIDLLADSPLTSSVGVDLVYVEVEQTMQEGHHYSVKID